jgi:hypothetical protein
MRTEGDSLAGSDKSVIMAGDQYRAFWGLDGTGKFRDRAQSDESFVHFLFGMFITFREYKVTLLRADSAVSRRSY